MSIERLWQRNYAYSGVVDNQNQELLLGSADRVLAMRGCDPEKILSTINALDGNRTIEEVAQLTCSTVREVERQIDLLSKSGVVTRLQNNQADQKQFDPQWSPQFVIIGTRSWFNTINSAFSEFSAPVSSVEIEPETKMSQVCYKISELATIEQDSNIVVFVIQGDLFREGQLLRLDRTIGAFGCEWILVKTSNDYIQVGPWFSLPETCCFNCYLSRAYSVNPKWKARKRFDELCEHLELIEGRPVTERATTLGVAMLATAVDATVRRATSGHMSLFGQQIVVSPQTLYTSWHNILKLPRCCRCGVHLAAPEVSPWTF